MTEQSRPQRTVVKINKIYTRTGDRGDTGLVGGKRISKGHPRVEAYGDIDEANSFIGWARTCAERAGRSSVADQLALVQNELFDIGAEVATPPGMVRDHALGVSLEQVTRLESWIDSITEQLPELRSFVLPGGTELNAILHVTRAVVRRAERNLVRLTDGDKVAPEVLQYLNRLSDFLFALARQESLLAGAPEYLWVPGKSR